MADDKTDSFDMAEAQQSSNSPVLEQPVGKLDPADREYLINKLLGTKKGAQRMDMEDSLNKMSDLSISRAAGFTEKKTNPRAVPASIIRQLAALHSIPESLDRLMALHEKASRTSMLFGKPIRGQAAGLISNQISGLPKVAENKDVETYMSHLQDIAGTVSKALGDQSVGGQQMMKDFHNSLPGPTNTIVEAAGKLASSKSQAANKVLGALHALKDNGFDIEPAIKQFQSDGLLDADGNPYSMDYYDKEYSDYIADPEKPGKIYNLLHGEPAKKKPQSVSDIPSQVPQPNGNIQQIASPQAP